MTSAVVNLNENANRILNIIKAAHDFRNKSDAINFIITEYAKESELEVNPKYLKKLVKMIGKPSKKYKSAEEMFSEYE